MLKEMLSAFASPSWWVLTVIVGLLLNVLAPFLNKWIESAWAARSTKRSAQVDEEESFISGRAQYLKAQPTGKIEAKTDCIYWVVRIILLLCIYLILIQVAFSAPVPYFNVIAIPIAIAAFFHISRYRRNWRKAVRVHNLVCAGKQT